MGDYLEGGGGEIGQGGGKKNFARFARTFFSFAPPTKISPPPWKIFLAPPLKISVSGPVCYVRRLSV